MITSYLICLYFWRTFRYKCLKGIYSWIIYSVSILLRIAKFNQQEIDNGEFYFQSYVFLVFVNVFHKSEIRDVEAIETDELIQDIELANQKMMNFIRMKMIVMKLMTAIQNLTRISKRTQRQIETQSTHEMPHMLNQHW